MKKIVLTGLTCLLAFLLIYVDASDARRFGGGRSFGSRPSYNKLFNKKTTPSKPSQGQTTSKNPTSPRRTPGFGGLFGGLLMGGLLGSLLFGGHYMGPNLLDIILIGGILFLLFKVLRSRRSPALAGSQEPSQNHSQPGRRFDSAWDQLRTKPESSQSSAPEQGIPDFDTEEFINGAKSAFVRLQESWDARDLEDIRQFTTPDFFQEITSQAAQDPNPGQTEILLLNAQLVESQIEGSTQIASVLFDVLMREDQKEQQPKQVREVWHFSRRGDDPSSNWTLEGIQQLEN
jgi:predicted lipid-binding transport protein (Tim44 family)